MQCPVLQVRTAYARALQCPVLRAHMLLCCTERAYGAMARTELACADTRTSGRPRRHVGRWVHACSGHESVLSGARAVAGRRRSQTSLRSARRSRLGPYPPSRYLLRPSYAMSGTGLAYAATPLRVVLRHVWY
eukprot:2235592-Rhodomonas_salina.1